MDYFQYFDPHRAAVGLEAAVPCRKGGKLEGSCRCYSRNFDSRLSLRVVASATVAFEIFLWLYLSASATTAVVWPTMEYSLPRRWTTCSRVGSRKGLVRLGIVTSRRVRISLGISYRISFSFLMYRSNIEDYLDESTTTWLQMTTIRAFIMLT